MTKLPPVSFLHRLADAASGETLPRFRTELDVEEKFKPGYRFDPVTLADKEAERVLRDLISSEYPDHAILGEEYGETGTGPWKWVIDPVDGTRPFICGIPVWGTLIGLTLEDRSVMGMMASPSPRNASGAMRKERGPRTRRVPAAFGPDPRRICREQSCTRTRLSGMGIFRR